MSPLGPGAPGSPENIAALQEMALGDDQRGQDQMLKMVMRAIGVDPGSPGLFGNSIIRGISEALKPAWQTAGLAGGQSANPYLDTAKMLSGLINSNNLYGGLRDYAGKAREQIMGPNGILGLTNDAEGIALQNSYLNSLLAMESAGANPLLRQATADSARRAFLDYEWEAFNNPSGPNAPGGYAQWLSEQDNPAYGNILRLFGGR